MKYPSSSAVLCGLKRLSIPGLLGEWPVGCKGRTVSCELVLYSRMICPRPFLLIRGGAAGYSHRRLRCSHSRQRTRPSSLGLQRTLRDLHALHALCRRGGSIPD